MRIGELGIIPVLAMLAGLLAPRGPSNRDDKDGTTREADLAMPGDQAAATTKVPDGFKVTLFACEPDVRQPIAFTIDDRGRLWVVECYSYPNWMPGAERGHDRVLIFEDADGDGRFDKRSVFWDQGDNLFGIAVGFGGVWLCATPNVIFLPDRNADDVPDGEPEIVLDGWDPKCQHNGCNALNWGPDGWLYGCNGILGNSMVGPPGTREAQRVPFNCGVWRIHPVTRVFEVVANGTTNPWGLDFDDTGEMFITNCVIPHLFHVVPGAHFQRMYGQDFNPHLYELMSSCADHIHWGGGDWTSSRGGQGVHSEAGGGHAHAGAMVYLGDNWPETYRNSIFMLNIHGRRVNQDHLGRSGSRIVATHEKDFLFASDAWFRGLELKYGPDGGVFMTDWSDIGECHDYDSIDGVHRENGRIYKITFGDSNPVRPDLAKLADAELVKLQLHPNDWYVRHARRLLHERAASGRSMAEVHQALWRVFHTQGAVSRKLRAVWALHVTGGLDPAALVELSSHESEYVRTWAVRLACEDKRHFGDSADGQLLSRFGTLAAEDPSPLVRLYLASALQRIPLEKRSAIIEGLVQHEADAADTNLSLMIWYGIEPVVPMDHAAAAALAGRARISLIGRFVARRIAVDASRTAGTSGPPSGLAALLPVIEETRDAVVQRDLLRGIYDALKGQKQLAMPAGWPTLSGHLADDLEVRELALVIGLIFGDARAVASLKETMANRTASTEARQWAMQALVEGGGTDLVPALYELLDDAAVRGAAIRSLAAFGDAATPRQLLRRYATLTESERADAVSALASRPRFAQDLLAAIRDGIIAPRDVSPFIVRQLQAFDLKQINDELARVWGTVRPGTAEKKSSIAKYKSLLTPGQLEAADPAQGRQVFNRTCAQCHRLFGEGNEVGPDLTGSDRANLDFILENVLDPNAIVGRDYRLNVIATTNGRVLSGIIRERTDKALVIQTANERVTLATEDIDAMKESPVSMMPEGIFEKLTVEEIRDLVAYLAAKSQVALPRE